MKKNNECLVGVKDLKLVGAPNDRPSAMFLFAEKTVFAVYESSETSTRAYLS